jgi:hypothetical protein
MVKRIVAEVVGMDDRGVTKGEADVRPVLDCYADADGTLSSGTTGH